MNVVDQFLIAVLKHKDLDSLGSLNTEWVDDKELRRYKFISDYYKEHSELPGIRSFVSTYKLDETDADSKPKYYLGKIKERYIYTELADKVPSLLKTKLKADPIATLDEFRLLLSGLNLDSAATKDVSYSDKATLRYEDYLKRKTTKGVTYLSMGHPVLDKLFYGFGKTDLITLGGRAGSRKTFTLCKLALLTEDVLPETYGDILFISNEMNEEQIARRLDAIKYHLPYESFLRGTLSRRQAEYYKERLEELEHTNSRLKILHNCKTIDELAFKIGLYKPSLVMVDGSYLMEPKLKEGWEKLTFITRQLKQLTKDFCIPIINTTQLKRASGKGEKSTSFDAQDDFAYSNSFNQDSDLAIRMYQDKDMVYRQEVGWQIAKGRELNSEIGVTFKCNLTTMDLDFVETGTEATETVEF